MHSSGKHYHTIWFQSTSVFMIDQNALPFNFRIIEAKNCRETCEAILNMTTRGAGAIGAAAGFAMAQAFLEAGTDNRDTFVREAKKQIESTRPTARNLFYATDAVYRAGMVSTEAAVAEAQRLAEENVADALKIGEYGNTLIREGARILTHCNAGWLGFVDWGSALAPVYVAHRSGKKLFVYADETRPRSQGARLTAWELAQEGVPHSIVPDNAGAFLMSNGLIDLVITGADRIAANGDTANKIGTFEKAILAKEFGIPFYIAAPLSTFDFSIRNGSGIIIENRSEDEVHYIEGPDQEGVVRRIRVTAPGASALNPAFDVTPASYISAFITDKGIFTPSQLDQLRKS